MSEFIQFILLITILYFVTRPRRLPGNGAKAVAGKTPALILDTCALIDGRIIEVSKSGFIPEKLIVPEFVLHELQLLADGSDAHKRERARFGLDVVRELQDSRHCEVLIDRTKFDDIKEVDAKLVELAKRLGANLYTTDFNLNKVAEIEGVRVLNVNELAQNVRPIAIPGEYKSVKITQRGSNQNQGVGYLEDGTMIVVDNATKYIGKSVEVEVTRIHQTAAGKMLFGILKSKPQGAPASKAASQNPQQKTTALRRRFKTGK